MKKIELFILVLIVSLSKAFPQEVATDFIATDCNNQVHHLFDELDDGKVVIIAWVMPCASCIADPANAFSLSETFAASNPDKVNFYLVDDYANTSCQTLQSWATNYGMGKSTIFSHPDIKMSDYGQDGMPKIVVLGGGGTHKVYYNKNFTSVGIEDAINQAIAESEPLDTETLSTIISRMEVFPNPVKSNLNIRYTIHEPLELGMEVRSLYGESLYKLEATQQMEGTHEMDIDIRDFPNGVYLLRLYSKKGFKTIQFTVHH